jgi:cytochrome c556
MRTLVVGIIGLLMGAILASVALNAWKARHAASRSVMTLTQMHYASLLRQSSLPHCDLAKANGDLQALRVLAADIPSVFELTGLTKNSRFNEIQRGLAKAASPVPQDCAELARMIPALRDGCNQCHREFR